NFVEDVKSNLKKSILLFLKDAYKIDILKEMLQLNNINYETIDELNNVILESKLYFVKNDDAISLGLVDERIEIFTEKELFRELKLKHTKYRSAYQNTVKISSKEDLN